MELAMVRKPLAPIVCFLMISVAFFFIACAVRADPPRDKVKPIFLKDPSVQVKEEWAYKSGILVAFSPDGKTLLSFHGGNGGPRIYYWNLSQKKLVETFWMGGGS